MLLVNFTFLIPLLSPPTFIPGFILLCVSVCDAELMVSTQGRLNTAWLTAKDGYCAPWLYLCERTIMQADGRWYDVIAAPWGVLFQRAGGRLGPRSSGSFCRWQFHRATRKNSPKSWFRVQTEDKPVLVLVVSYQQKMLLATVKPRHKNKTLTVLTLDIGNQKDSEGINRKQ